VCTTYRTTCRMWPKFVAINRRDDLYFLTVIILALLHNKMSAVPGKPVTSSWADHNFYRHICHNVCVIWVIQGSLYDEMLAIEVSGIGMLPLYLVVILLFLIFILKYVLPARCSTYISIGSASSTTHFQDGLSGYDTFFHHLGYNVVNFIFCRFL
jgi:hypothetical protein